MSRHRDTVALVSAFQSLRTKEKKTPDKLVGFQRRIHIGEDAPKPRLDADKFKGVGARRSEHFPILHDIALKISKGEIVSILDLAKDKFWVIHFKASKGSIPIILPVTDKKMLMSLYNSTTDDMFTDPDIDYVAAFDKTDKDFPSPVQEVVPSEFITETRTETKTITEPGTVQVKEVSTGGTGAAIAVLGALGIAAVASKKKHR